MDNVAPSSLISLHTAVRTSSHYTTSTEYGDMLKTQHSPERDSIFTEAAARLGMMILTVIVEICSHVSFTDMMTDDRTELNVLTLYHYN